MKIFLYLSQVSIHLLFVRGWGYLRCLGYTLASTQVKCLVLPLLQLNVCLCRSCTVRWLPVLIHLFNKHNDRAHYTPMGFKNVRCKQYTKAWTLFGSSTTTSFSGLKKLCQSLWKLTHHHPHHHHYHKPAINI